jgi:2-polyprenyl-3-methyl-5-hydroxy-6-metoxy-1,4-benzoquinol methylase
MKPSTVHRDISGQAMQGEHYTSWKDWEPDRFGQWSRRQARYFDWHVARCGLAGSGAGRRLLEVGYGNGAFLGWARGQGFEVMGIEAQPVLLERARNMGWAVASSVDELDAAAQFDLVVAIDVVEHLSAEQCSALLAAAVARLAPRGCILLRVPNGDSPFGRAHQHGDLTHTATYGLSKLRQLAAMHKLEIAAYGEAPWHRNDRIARSFNGLLRATARTVLESWIRFSYGWNDLSLAPNLVVVLRA